MFAPEKSPSFIPAKKPQYVEELNDAFLSLFPFRHDYLWAEHPHPGERPDWRTEDRHPLSDRLILQGAYLYGVRFDSTTHYLMVDIDRKSRYHPARDPFAIGRMVEALDAIGLCAYVAIQSSCSEGIHLYFPWGGLAHPSWAIAQAAESLLQAAGFKLDRGQLELFPNPKRHGDSTAYNGHRLPLQQGSYLLNEEFEAVFSTRERFVQQWQFASSRNEVSRAAIDRAIASQRKVYKKIGMTAQKFLNDLNADIEAGWTGYGQTNYLIGRIALREYVFGHLYTGKILRGMDLQWRVLKIATELPGYKQFCRHLVEIAERVAEWVSSVEACPRYYPYGGDEQLETNPEEKPMTENEKRALEAQNRIRDAVAEMLNCGAFPEGVRNRIAALREYGVSPATLYKNKPLWHPDYIAESPEPAPGGVLQAIADETEDLRSPEPAPDGVLQAIDTISFYAHFPDPQGGGAYGERAVGGTGGVSTGSEKLSGPDLVRKELALIRQRKAAQKVHRWRIEEEVPPDERWFAQMRLSLEVVSDGS